MLWWEAELCELLVLEHVGHELPPPVWDVLVGRLGEHTDR